VTGQLIVAIPTNGRDGMKDAVSRVFSRARTFTILAMEGGNTRSVEVVENEAAELNQGAGPMAVKILKDRGVDLVISGDLGPGASTLLETVGIETTRVKPGVKVSEAVRQYLLSTNELYA
jgi:predicted Fe-Mo cluster-binding NifX family protein